MSAAKNKRKKLKPGVPAKPSLENLEKQWTIWYLHLLAKDLKTELKMKKEGLRLARNRRKQADSLVI